MPGMPVATFKSLDPKDLNPATWQEQHRTPTVGEVVHEFASSHYFTKVDLKSRYWMTVLPYESFLLTTFNSPFGQ